MCFKWEKISLTNGWFLSTRLIDIVYVYNNVANVWKTRLDYCNSLLAGLPACAIRPLQLIQNAAARLVFNLPKFSHTTPLLRSLHWLPVTARIHFKTLAYHAVNGSGPSYIQDMVKPYTPALALRSASAKRLAAPALRGGPKFPSAKHVGLLSWLQNGGMSSPLTSGQQKAYTLHFEQ